MKTFLPSFLALTIAASSLAGCGAAAPPRELVDARAAYRQASSGPAAELTPAQLLTARTALETAEKAFADDPNGEHTKDLAYVAQRKAQTAEAQGGAAKAQKQKDQSLKDLQSGQAHLQQQTEGALKSAREQLAAQKQALETERQARLEAEKKAGEAINKLAEIAAIKNESRGTVITLSGSVLFASGQAVLLPSAQEKLQQVATALQSTGERNIVVEGHTDSQGSRSSNEELSFRRADAVRNYLVSQGIPVSRIRSQGLADTRPVADNRTPEGRANNRRVEIVVQPEGR